MPPAGATCRSVCSATVTQAARRKSYNRTWVATSMTLGGRCIMSNAAFTVHSFTPNNDVVTEDSAATQFINQHGDRLRFCHSRGRWLHWTGNYWEINNTRLAFHWARELARKLAEDQGKRSRIKIESTGFATGVEKFAR